MRPRRPLRDRCSGRPQWTPGDQSVGAPCSGPGADGWQSRWPWSGAWPRHPNPVMRRRRGSGDELKRTGSRSLARRSTGRYRAPPHTAMHTLKTPSMHPKKIKPTTPFAAPVCPGCSCDCAREAQSCGRRPRGGPQTPASWKPGAHGQCLERAP